MINGGRSAASRSTVALGIVEFLPHNDDRESEKHSIQHADGREFEPGDLIVRGKALKRHKPPDDERSEHKMIVRHNQNPKGLCPERRGGDEIDLT